MAQPARSPRRESIRKEIDLLREQLQSVTDQVDRLGQQLTRTKVSADIAWAIIRERAWAITSIDRLGESDLEAAIMAHEARVAADLTQRLERLVDKPYCPGDKEYVQAWEDELSLATPDLRL